MHRFSRGAMAMTFMVMVSLTTILGMGSSTAAQTPAAGKPTLSSALSGDCSKFLADVTIKDGARLKAGDNQKKTWRVKNCGTTTWTDFNLRLLPGVGTNDFAHAKNPTLVPVPAVKPGEEKEISVDFTVPPAGSYLILYELERPDGLRFGDPIWMTFTSQ